MPLYEYNCQSCHQTHEVIRKFSDPPLKKCPACGGKLVKKITPTTFQLKGSGWYKDGYSSPQPEKKGSPEPATPKKEGSPSAGSLQTTGGQTGQAKPAEKKEKN